MDITPEAVNAYFTPLDYFLYLFLVFAIMVVYYQWRWARQCRNNVLLKVVRTDGSAIPVLVPKEGNCVKLTNPKTSVVKIWPINKLAVIDVPFPGVGFIPLFLQKQIREVIVDEEDWEPLLNRGAYKDNVASPNVIKALKEIAGDQGLDEKIRDKLNEICGNLLAAPTREMIASPAVLGNLMHEKITEAVITVNKEMMDSITGLMKRLNKLVNPLVVYIGLGLIICLLAFAIYTIIPLAEGLGAIKSALGVVP